MKARFRRLYRKARNKQRRPHNGSVPSIGMLAALVLLLSACNLLGTPSQTGGSGTPVLTSITPTQVTSPTPVPTLPTITLQVVGPCPSSLANSWDHVVGTKPGVAKVQKVMCGSLEGSGSLDALVIVRYYTPDYKMDFFVYDNLTGTPNRRFAVQGLVQGDAQISPAGTIITSQLVSNVPIPPNVFKEYQWSAATASFAQILFPGLYPDVTHYQAERAQFVANTYAAQGKTPWQDSANSVVNKLASDIFHWTLTTTKTVTFNPPTSTYIVQETNTGTGGGGFVATLFHLDNVTTNIFEISKIAPLDAGTRISSPVPGVPPLTSPVSVNVTSQDQASGRVLGEVMIYDDTYTIVGNSGAIPSTGSGGYVNFTQLVSYHLNAPGLQEGVVAFLGTNQNNTSLSNQVAMVKVFFSA
jgi:hypothetical protein